MHRTSLPHVKNAVNVGRSPPEKHTERLCIATRVELQMTVCFPKLISRTYPFKFCVTQDVCLMNFLERLGLPWRPWTAVFLCWSLVDDCTITQWLFVDVAVRIVFTFTPRARFEEHCRTVSYTCLHEIKKEQRKSLVACHPCFF